jgi:DNA ligase (NAD+)
MAFLSKKLNPMLNLKQKQLLNQAQVNFADFNEEELFNIAQNSHQAHQFSDEQLVEFLQITNILYRGGESIITDIDYDLIHAELAKRQPNHLFLTEVEAEPEFFGKTVTLPVKMLSTEKAYHFEAIERWLTRIETAALELNQEINSLKFKITPKLDGYAAYDDGEKLYTRGNGFKGTDISRVFERGLQVAAQGKRGLGAGEIVINKVYFAKNLAQFFDNTRNFQASLIKEKNLSIEAEKAIHQQAAVFFPFALLPAWIGTAQQLRTEFNTIIQHYWHSTDYDVDGIVLEIIDEKLKNYLGATRHHHRWQIAYKENLNSAVVKVLAVTPQTSRSGRITPVAELEPTRLSGALIQRATAHYYGMVKEWGIAKNALIELTRSGEVIPKIKRVLQTQIAVIPEQCPSCKAELVWDANDLYCLNTDHCPAQIESSLEHFFKTLGNVDGFGEKIIEKLNANGISTVYEVYLLNIDSLINMGFGEKTSQNLLNQLIRSRQEPIEDWRFLGAFGIDRLGLGNCERLLANYSLAEIFRLSIEDLKKIDGFAEKTSEIVLNHLQAIQTDFAQLLALGFNLIQTKKSIINNPSPIFNRLLVFTGTLKRAKREDLIKQAKQLGAKVANSVSHKTDYLIAGENVGEKKITEAQQKGVKIITEDDYFTLLGK